MLKWLAGVLLVLIALLQFRLWFGEGGLRELAETRARADVVEAANEPLRARNQRLAAEVNDLKTGLDAIEERGRSELGMVRSDEQFFWVPGVVIESTLIEQNALPIGAGEGRP